MDTNTIAMIILFATFMIFMVLRVPVTFSMLGACVLTALYLGPKYVSSVFLRLGDGVQSFSFLAIPFFIFAGDIMAEGGVIANIEASGYLPTGAIADVTMRAKLRGLRDNNGVPLFKSDMQGATNYALDGNPMYFPLNGAYDASKALMISGDFNQLVYSVRQDITYKIFTEGVIQDPTTKEIVYNLMQNDMVALRAVMRLGWELPNPVNRIKGDKSKRCPFSILVSE